MTKTHDSQSTKNLMRALYIGTALLIFLGIPALLWQTLRIDWMPEDAWDAPPPQTVPLVFERDLPADDPWFERKRQMEEFERVTDELDEEMAPRYDDLIKRGVIGEAANDMIAMKAMNGVMADYISSKYPEDEDDTFTWTPLTHELVHYFMKNCGRPSLEAIAKYEPAIEFAPLFLEK